MHKKEEVYNGFWKRLGCILSLVAIVGIVTVFVIGVYLLVKGF
ncbi:MAG: hypothetical protein R2819_11780 [Allomuricauda sp.]